MIKIIGYDDVYQEGVEVMMNEIAAEFEEPIISRAKHKKQTTLDSYWIALNATEVVGTVGVIAVENQFAVLKNMMVKKAYRGKIYGVSHILLKTAINWCVKNKLPEVYLGTMHQFKAAQSFYLKNGFDEILEVELPKKFSINPLDKLFFKRDLTSQRSL